MKKQLIIALIATTIGTSIVFAPQPVLANTNTNSVIATATAQGWKQLENGIWNYVNENGSNATGWQKINGDWYYFNSNGEMQKGWQKVNGSWYYLKQDGAMITGWKWIETAWYYLNDSGEMLTGWQQLDNKWYYLNADGSMAKDTTIDGWLLDNSGVGHKVLNEANIDWDLTNKLNNSEWMQYELDYGKPDELQRAALDIALDRPISNLEELKKTWKIRSGDKVSYKEHRKIVKELKPSDIDVSKLTAPGTWKETNYLPNPNMGCELSPYKKVFAYYDSDKKDYQIIYVNIRLK